MKRTNEQELKALGEEISKLSKLAALQQELFLKLHDAVAGHQKVIEALDGQLRGAASGRPQGLGNSLN